MNSLLTELLNYYHLSEKEYEILSRPIEDVHLLEPTLIKGMNRVKSRIFEAIKNNEKIIIYGDYDCDGISATSIMYRTFQILNYHVSYYIPSRYLDGYGLNVKNVEKIAEAGFKLIICVDNGISQHEAIHRAKELGIDVIVVDHHEVPEERTEAYEIIHPTVSKISDVIGSGGYMALFVSGALLGSYDEYLVTIAGLSVISDLMELKGINRDVVRLAIHYFEKNKFLPLRLLAESPIISEKTFSMEIAPKINAIGRMMEKNEANLLVKYFTDSNDQDVYSLCDWINQINAQRKEITKSTVDNLKEDFSNLAGICVNIETKEGIIGLIANRFLNLYNVPSLVFTRDLLHPDILKGSIRSKEGFNVTKAFQSLEKYLVTGGGHSFAGGLSIKEADFDSFKKDFLKLCEEYQIEETNKPTIPLTMSEITMSNYQIVRSFAPFGMGFEEPLFSIENIPTRGLTFISDGKHLSTPLTIQSKLLGFNMKKDEIQSYPYVNLEGNFNLSSFRGAKTLEFRVSKYKCHN